jgi:nucleotide-binding universal stress UspA family protein
MSGRIAGRRTVPITAAATVLDEHLTVEESRRVERDVLHSATTRAILGRTRCPVMVVPYRRLSATRVSW